MRRHLPALLALLLSGPIGHAADVVAAWPDPASFTAGQAANFRTPAFSGLPLYPDKSPLYNDLYLPPGYDPTRSYPLCIRFQPQDSKPWASEMKGYFGPDVITLAVSRFQADAADHLVTLSHNAVFLSSIHWVMSNWNVDRSRVIFGGFSAGGWDASAVGMTPGFDGLSTHFLILGAGVRGAFRLPEQAGKPVLIATGSKDMNFSWGAKAAETLKNAKLAVTYFVEPEVGHTVGPLMKEQAASWFAGFDPAAHAADWLADGEARLAKPATRAAAIERLASVATLGASRPEAAKALALLDQGADLGEPLKLLANARTALASNDFHATRHLAGALLKAAGKAKSPRLQKQAEPLARDSWEWQCVAHQVAVKAAWDRGCGLEAMLLAQGGAGVYKKTLADWADHADPFPALLKQLQALPAQTHGKDEAKAQKCYAELRLKLWNDQLTSDAALQKAVKQLTAAIEPLPAAAVRQRGEELLAMLNRHGQLMAFPAK